MFIMYVLGGEGGAAAGEHLKVQVAVVAGLDPGVHSLGSLLPRAHLQTRARSIE